MKLTNSDSGYLWVDYKSLSHSKTSPTHVGLPYPRSASTARKTPTKPKLRKLPLLTIPNGLTSGLTHKNTNAKGAIRLNQVAKPKESLLNFRNCSFTGIAMICGVAVFANATTSVDQTSNFKSALLTAAEAPPPQPTFRFDDTDAILSASNDSLNHRTRNNMPGSTAYTAQTFATLLPPSLLPQKIQSEKVIEEIVESTLKAKVPQKIAASLLPETFKPNKPNLAEHSKVEKSNIIDIDETLAKTATAFVDTDTLISSALVKAPSLKENYVQKIAVASGDTFSNILNDQGINKADLNQLLSNDIVKEHLTNLKIGNKLNFEYRWDGHLDNISVKINRDTKVQIKQAGTELRVAKVHLPLEYERVVTSGTIENSLYLAAERANLNQSTIMELANIFEWELDFARDIRKGDNFSIVYDRLYRDDKYIGDGDILAAEFIRGDRRHSAIRFTDDDGNMEYYSVDGQSKRRTFMRHPVDVVRITSRFDPNRLHPVLHKIRAHKGVDYGAPHGSPIYATADGKVAHSGKKSAYGNTVILKHGENRTTLYAHMSRIAKKSRVGTRIKRGDVIGYVGKTGRVTGTHLHYEFRINGNHVDPLKVQFPSAKPLDKKYHARLKATANELVAQMRSVIKKEQQIASIE